jgi:3-oxoacyl-[acyl-carrier-protein] synthase III
MTDEFSEREREMGQHAVDMLVQVMEEASERAGPFAEDITHEEMQGRINQAVAEMLADRPDAWEYLAGAGAILFPDR